jgi:GDSL-like Lipase/Acylhydrolase family
VSRHRFARSIAVACVAAVALASCSHSERHANAPGSRSTAPPGDVLVAIGSDATFGADLRRPLSEAWPQLLFHEAFPISTVLINAADGGVTLQHALTVQVPLALEVHATVVAVWLGDIDVEQHVPAATFEADLDLLVRRLRSSGARVLLGNLSRAEPLAAAYDDAIGRVARARGATLVDLAAALAATPTVGPSTHVNAATSRVIARAFASAVTTT